MSKNTVKANGSRWFWGQWGFGKGKVVKAMPNKTRRELGLSQDELQEDYDEDYEKKRNKV